MLKRIHLCSMLLFLVSILCLLPAYALHFEATSQLYAAILSKNTNKVAHILSQQIFQEVVLQTAYNQTVALYVQEQNSYIGRLDGIQISCGSHVIHPSRVVAGLSTIFLAYTLGGHIYQLYTQAHKVFQVAHKLQPIVAKISAFLQTEPSLISKIIKFRLVNKQLNISQEEQQELATALKNVDLQSLVRVTGPMLLCTLVAPLTIHTAITGISAWVTYKLCTHQRNLVALRTIGALIQHNISLIKKDRIAA